MIKTKWTGDDGRTKLFGGEDCNKDDPRVDAYGDIDELNSYLGLARSRLDDKEMNEILARVQKDLFSIGAELAKAKQSEKAKLSNSHIKWIEDAVARIDSQLPSLSRFIVPGGSPAASLLHVSRSICRRAERKCVALKKKEIVSQEIIKYLNRLSSLLFSLSRLANKRAGTKEEEW